MIGALGFRHETPKIPPSDQTRIIHSPEQPKPTLSNSVSSEEMELTLRTIRRPQSFIERLKGAEKAGEEIFLFLAGTSTILFITRKR